MAKNTMTALTISGPAERLDEAVEHFFVNRSIHPEDASSFLAGVRAWQKPEVDDRYAAPLAQADALLADFALAPERADFEQKGYTLRGCEAYLETLSTTAAAQKAERETLEKKLAANRAVLETLSHFASVAVPVSELAALRYVHGRFGRIHPENWPACQAESAKLDGLFLMETDHSEEWVWLLALSVRDLAEEADSLLARCGFERILPDSVPLDGRTAAETIAALEAENRTAQEHLAALDAARNELLAENREELLSRRSYLKFKSACCAARRYAALAKGRFYLVGWVDSSEADAFAAEVERVVGFRCVRAAAQKDHPAPVKLKKRRFGGVFDSILKMYGLPSGGETDPRLFLAISYTLFFGIMFGDVGQGACLILIGWLLWKKTGGSIWRIFSICGISSVIFGLVYGSCFGFEELFPWGGFHVLEGDNLMTMLLLAVALGAVVILCCMVLNIINALRRRDLQAGLFGPNGLCGMVFYLSLLLLVVSLYSGLFAFPKLCIWLCIVLPLVLIWVGEPLGELVAGNPEWKKAKIGDVLMTGFFDIFESLLSYLSNTMSFLRVGAFAISHAGMMMVVFLIAEVCKGAAGNILVLVIGNAFVAVLEAGLASIQIIRLQFYEMFGRYYSGRGRAFAPLTVDYKH